MITPATAILTVLPGRVARCRSVMYPSCPLWWRPRGLLIEEQRGSAGPDLRARLAPSRVRRHLLDASRPSRAWNSTSAARADVEVEKSAASRLRRGLRPGHAAQPLGSRVVLCKVKQP